MDRIFCCKPEEQCGQHTAPHEGGGAQDGFFRAAGAAKPGKGTEHNLIASTV